MSFEKYGPNITSSHIVKVLSTAAQYHRCNKSAFVYARKPRYIWLLKKYRTRAVENPIRRCLKRGVS